MGNGAFLLIPIFFPVLAGLAVFACNCAAVRQIYVGSVLVLNAAAVFLLSFLTGTESFTLWQFTPDLAVSFRFDPTGKLFACLIAVVWTLACIYAFLYMRHEGKEKRYFAFAVMAVGVLTGLCMAGNLMTLYMFYEFMTLVTVPLVIHSQGADALRAGLKYLGYSVFGAGLALIGFFFLQHYGTSTVFAEGGVLDMAKIAGNEQALLVIFLVMMVGFGCKAGLMPLQAWLPTAHPVAPAPASAVLSGIITKMGILGMIRTVFYLFDPAFLQGTWVQVTLVILALATVFVGSMLAFKEQLLKKRLAYSTVSQVSYVIFGIMLLNPQGLSGALLQVVFHALAKNALFLAAGAVIYKTGVIYVKDLTGMGKKMPVVMWCFTIASLSLIGIPPTGGFVAKWDLALGALAPEFGGILGYVGPAVLLVSALLTAGYLMPIVREAFFPGKDFDYDRLEKSEPNAYMTVPLVLLCVAVVALGMFPMGLEQIIDGISGAVLRLPG